MDKVLTPEMAPYCFAYLDDIIIATETFEEHLFRLEVVLRRIKEAGLVLHREKSKSCRSEVKYLGFFWSIITVCKLTQITAIRRWSG